MPLSPMAAAAAMSFSSLWTVVNSPARRGLPFRTNERRQGVNWGRPDRNPVEDVVAGCRVTAMSYSRPCAKSNPRDSKLIKNGT
jgi:hypothetical protein